MRYKSCSYCGRTHPVGYECPMKPKHRAKDMNTAASKTRSSSRWQRTRDLVKQRDSYLCQLCIRDYPGTIRHLEHDHLSVHHIIPLEADESKAFDFDNLITLCNVHHEMAEGGGISVKELLEIAKNQNISAGF